MTDPWLPIAREILAGKWDKADNSTLESILTGIRGNPDPDCVQAKAAVEKLLGRKKKG